MLEGHRLFLITHHPLVAGGRGCVGIAEELYIAAQGNQAQLPACPGTRIGPSPHFGAEADGKDIHLHPVPAGHQKVPHLVNEHDDGQDQQKNHHVVPDAVDHAVQE